MQCIKCKLVDDESKMLLCDSCERPIHRDCSTLSASELRVMDLKTKRGLKFFCEECTEGIRLVPKLYKVINKLQEEVDNLKSQATCSSEEFIISELYERQKRMNNIIIHNLPEPTVANVSIQEADKNELKDIFKTITGEEINISQTVRLGKKNKNGARTLKVMLTNAYDVMNIIKNKRKIGNSKRIYIMNDLTMYQRENMNKLKKELKERVDKGEEDIFIKYVKGIPQIVKAQKN